MNSCGSRKDHARIRRRACRIEAQLMNLRKSDETSKLDRRIRSVSEVSIRQEATCLSRSVPKQLVIVNTTPPQSNSGSARGSDKVCTASMLSSPQGVRVRLLASFLPSLITPLTSLPSFTLPSQPFTIESNMSTSQLSSNPTPYSALSNVAEDPLHFHDPHTPSPSYSSDEKAASMNPYPIVGTLRTQLEFYHKELTRLKEENAKLKEAQLKVGQKELNELRGEAWWEKKNFVDNLIRFRDISALVAVVLWILALVSGLCEKFLFKQTCS